MISEELMTINYKIILQLNRMKYTATILNSDIDKLTKIFDS